jgi:hypothetical protein
LTISFTGGPPENLEDNLCAAEYEFDVVETPELVTVTVHQLKLADPPDVNYGCDGHGCARAERVILDGSGLANRTVIDGHSGRTMTVIDAPGVPARGIECDAERKGRKEAEVSSTTPTFRIPS